MDSVVRDLILRLHAGAHRCVLCLTGGGAGLAAWLLSVPGASRSVLEVIVPYHQDALSDFLGRVPVSFCSAETTEQMARRAWERAGRLAPGEPVAGVACTAALRSDRPKKGAHRFYLAVHTLRLTATVSLTLIKEARAREEEEEVLDRVLLNTLASVLGIDGSVPIALLPGEEVLSRRLVPQADQGSLAAFLVGHHQAVCVEADGRVRPLATPPAVLLPGAFNPLHEGHLGMAEAAAKLLGRAAAFELTTVNADKPPLSDEEVRRRVAQFDRRAPLWLTRAPTFAEKARLFPGTVFVIGVDTAVRVVQPRFYGSPEHMAAALADLRAAGCRFLVAGRIDGQGSFQQLDGLNIPAELSDLFTPLPFRADVSSTQLRVGRAFQPDSSDPKSG
jgi:hypothetical protein